MSSCPECPSAQLPTEDFGNTKTKSSTTLRSRGWIITINNPSETIRELASKFEALKCLYVFGNEIAPSTGTPHIQGYVYNKNKISNKELLSIMPRASLIVAKGSPYHNRNYCSKGGDFLTNIEEEDLKPTFKEFKEKIKKDLLNKYYTNVTWKPWQQEILDILKTESNSRTVHWYWEPTGNVGKSFLTKYIYLTMDAIVANGKKADIYNQVLAYFQTLKVPKVILTDIARSEYSEHIYTVLENLKNGFIYSGKYEGGVCAFDHPHVIVFSNREPYCEEVSLDQWHIVKIPENI